MPSVYDVLHIFQRLDFRAKPKMLHCESYNLHKTATWSYDYSIFILAYLNSFKTFNIQR